jgi:hypothetical protein
MDGLVTLERFWGEHADWSQKTFGSDIERGPEGPLKHLALEVQECLANTGDLEEYADLILLTFDACRRAGFDYSDLTLACYRKLSKNRERKWPKTSPDQPVEHIREGEVQIREGAD